MLAMDRTKPNPVEDESRIENSHMQYLADTSRSVCCSSAVQIARSFDIQRTRFDLSFIVLPSLQAALTAADTLMDGISHANKSVHRDLYVRHLQVLFHALSATRTFHQPAETMIKAIESFIKVGAHQETDLLMNVEEPIIR